MRRIITNTTAVLILLFAGIATAGQGIWQDVSTAAISLEGGLRHFDVDHTALLNQLDLAPQEALGDRSHTIQLPMPDGSLERFAIVESSIMEPALAARYPEIKTFKIYGVDDPMASGRVDITPQGFHAMLFTAKGRLFIDPDHSSGQAGQYLSRYRSGQSGQGFICGVHQMESKLVDQPELLQKSANRTPKNLLVYRLAVAATKEYVIAVNTGGPDPIAQAQAAIVTASNRVSAIYERDLGIRLTLVGNNDQLIEDSSSVDFDEDDFDNGNALALLPQNQVWIDSKIGSGAYDVGHVFSTGFGGIAVLGSVCSNSSKAQGTSGTAGQGDPLDDSFYIDYVAHEIGHQFNANHSFNGTTNSCGSGNRNSATAFEPGSGSTIMAYAGICADMNGTENLQMNSDATFHAGSISEIDSFTKNAGNCYAFPPTPTNNNDPTIAPIANRVIPANTPFVLDIDSTAPDPVSDPDMDVLGYQWDQMDAGCPTNSASFGTDNGSNALFRSYVPRSETWRNFPALGTQVRGRFDKAEVLPCNNRDLDFRLTARDGNSGQDTEDLRVSVTNAAGPFAITNLNAAQTLTSGTAFDVIWDVANTDLPPIYCANVDIDLLTFSETVPPVLPTDPLRTYSIYNLATMIPNNGNASVTINPIDSAHPKVRIRVKCNGNIFYDISDADLVLAEAFMQTPNMLGDTDDAYYFPGNMFITDAVAPVCGPVVDCTVPTTAKSGKKSGGSGAFDYLWLLLMTAVIALVKVYRRYGLQ